MTQAKAVDTQGATKIGSLKRASTALLDLAASGDGGWAGDFRRASPSARECEHLIRAFADFSRQADSISCAEEFHCRIREIDDRSRMLNPSETQQLRASLIQETKDEFGQSDMFRRAIEKPLGYAGDYLTIEWIYAMRAESRSSRGRFWDRFYHEQIAPKAVRERKDRFQDFLKAAVQAAPGEEIRILSVGSGPCREITEGLDASGLAPSEVTIDCVDIDHRAAAYGREILGETWGWRSTFHVGNAMRFRSASRFNLVWSSGLFDYFNARQASFLANRLHGLLTPHGVMAIGNFSDQHATRSWIEWCGEWFLTHRNDEEMRRIALDAGLCRNALQIFSDSHNAIRYLVVTA